MGRNLQPRSSLLHKPPLSHLSSSAPYPEAIRALAERGLQQLAKARAVRSEVSAQAGAALLCGFAAKGVLMQAQRDPERVISGLQPASPFALRAGLLLRSFTGRW